MRCGIDVDADAARAVLLGGGHRNPAVATPEVVDNIVLADVGHLQHGFDDGFGGGHVDDIGTAGGRLLRDGDGAGGNARHDHRGHHDEGTNRHARKPPGSIVSVEYSARHLRRWLVWAAVALAFVAVSQRGAAACARGAAAAAITGARHLGRARHGHARRGSRVSVWTRPGARWPARAVPVGEGRTPAGVDAGPAGRGPLTRSRAPRAAHCRSGRPTARASGSSPTARSGRLELASGQRDDVLEVGCTARRQLECARRSRRGDER